MALKKKDLPKGFVLPSRFYQFRSIFYPRLKKDSYTITARPGEYSTKSSESSLLSEDMANNDEVVGGGT